MTQRTITRPFAHEYLEATGSDVEWIMIDPFRKMICIAYVEWLERELGKARGKYAANS